MTPNALPFLVIITCVTNVAAADQRISTQAHGNHTTVTGNSNVVNNGVIINNPQASPEIVEKIRPVRVALSGIWTTNNDHPAYSSTLLITSESDHSFKFEINSNSGENLCELKGVAKVDDYNNALFTDTENSAICSVTFNFNESDLSYTVTSTQCSGYCGIGADFDGIYKKRGEFSKKVADYFVERGVLTEINAVKFRQLVGK